MRRLFNRLPGPLPVRILIAAVVVIVVLVLLFFVYDWMGTNLLDSGGTIS